MGFSLPVCPPAVNATVSLVIHCHSFKGVLISCAVFWIWVTIYAFRIYINKTHHYCRQEDFLNLFHQSNGFLRCQILRAILFHCPSKYLFRMPNIFSTSCKTEGFQSHDSYAMLPARIIRSPKIICCHIFS